VNARRRSVAAAVALAAALLGCTVDTTFPATSTCPSEPRAAGTLPELEALVPTQLVVQAADGSDVDRPPDTVDSGWSCLDASLGTFASHGVTRLQFAGATWNEGDGEATVSAVFSTPASDPRLEPGWVEEFYESTAHAGRLVSNVETGRPSFAGTGPAWRLDAINDLSLQTVVVWPDAEIVRVVILATNVDPGASRVAHDEQVRLAVEGTSSVGG
jgi:hypothetical protein